MLKSNPLEEQQILLTEECSMYGPKYIYGDRRTISEGPPLTFETGSFVFPLHKPGHLTLEFQGICPVSAFLPPSRSDRNTNAHATNVASHWVLQIQTQVLMLYGKCFIH